MQRFLSDDLYDLDKRLSSIVSSKVSLINRISKFVIHRKGKQMRPMFVLLIARCLGTVTETTYRALAMVELLHTATLIHDDVVDNSPMRRRFFSVNALWKNKVAVLIGDYFFSKTLLIALEHKEYDVLEITSRAIKEMIEGELLQAEQSRIINTSEEKYFETIEKKTGSLIGVCFATGGYSALQDMAKAQELYTLGTKIGLAFQIKDDLFDYEPQKLFSLGKPVGVDIREKKVTLPLNYTLNRVSESQRKELLKVIKKKKPTNKELAKVTEVVRETGGVAYARNKANEIVTQAKDALSDILPESESRKMLFKLIDYVIQRSV